MQAHEPVNILLVDDQPGKLLSYEAILSGLGENLIKANSGREALEHLLKTEITVVLMDVSMPELDGFELAEIIRQHPRFQKTAIIFVSAVHLSDLDQVKGYKSGAVDYVSVPVIPELLRAKVSVFAELYRKTRDSERLTRELEDRVTARTAELEASMLRQMALTEQLREADRRKDEFLALLAHELRNPLAPVVNAVNIMRLKQNVDPDLLWCREVIERQAIQLTRLVDDLLDVSRITLGKIKLRPERLDIATAIAGAVELSRPLIESHRHEFSITMPEQPIALNGDLARLTQVVANLLNNAAKYQNEAGRIELIVEQVEREAIITVRDRGIGIPPQMLSEVFELFSQGERTLDRSQGGLGIGLSLVKTVVEMHGGSVSATSDGVDRGSAFVIRLPCLRPGESNGRPTAHPTLRNVGPPRRILVVDDSKDAAESLAMLLSLSGHQVMVAHDGMQAVAMAAAERPEVILLDIGLPGMDGYEVCRRARQGGLTDALIIAMTGYGQERDRQRSKDAGFDTHTVKPVELSHLLELLAARP
jgi:signal transduction histidine kinase